MTDKQAKLREAIRKVIHELLDEISTTSAVPGYLTPKAFAGSKGNLDRSKSISKKLGYTLTDKGKEDSKPNPLKENLSYIKTEYNELLENYYAYRNDPTKQPHQKIGEAIAELNRQIKLMERVLRMNGRLKKEYNITNEQLWKKTVKRMGQLEGKLIELAGRLREMRG